MPQGFEALATKRGQPLYPPGRDVRCIVSFGMLTEGWDCNTATVDHRFTFTATHSSRSSQYSAGCSVP
ncbi:MAG TPA: hypothetical protein VFO19_13500, partial [Vicinamibacterales bacterium]|nr:hypothetical protein [Vicinamibacterales bacterium]